MNTALQTALQELAALPAADTPVLSVYVDWAPDGSGKRPSVRVVDDELRRLGATLEERGPQRDGFEADRQRIMDYLNGDAPVDAAGLAIFACQAADLWRPMALEAPVENEVALGHQPHLFQLAHIGDDYETYAVALVDSQESRILLVTAGDMRQVGHTEASEEIRRFDAGGSAAMIFQHRTDNLVKAQTKDMAEVLEKTMRRAGVDKAIIIGNDSVKGAVMGSLSSQLKGQVLDYINFDLNAPGADLMAVLAPIIRDAERAQEQADLDALEEQLATKGGLGVAGRAATAMALSKGQVRLLLLDQAFEGQGGLCPSCGLLWADERAECEADGSALTPVPLREAFVAKAFGQQSSVQVVAQGELLAGHEGVGALLWYNDTVVQPNQEQEASA
jgi:peptide subunit release factor 1 (eRF1)